jgi:hypothetical protein
MELPYARSDQPLTEAAPAVTAAGLRAFELKQKTLPKGGSLVVLREVAGARFASRLRHYAVSENAPS